MTTTPSFSNGIFLFLFPFFSITILRQNCRLERNLNWDRHGDRSMIPDPKTLPKLPFFKNLFFKASFMFCFSALSAMSQRSLKLSWKCLTWVKSNFLKMGQPRPLLSFIFGLFELKLQFKQQICVKKYPSSLRCQDSNPQPSDHESPPITTRPGLPPSSNFLCKRFLKGGRLSPRNDKN